MEIIIYQRYEIKYLVCSLDILFSSNHNIHDSSCGLCFWASDPLKDRFREDGTGGTGGT